MSNSNSIVSPEKHEFGRGISPKQPTKPNRFNSSQLNFTCLSIQTQYKSIQINTNHNKNNTNQYKSIQINTNHNKNNTIQYNTIQYNTIQYNTIQYNTKQINQIKQNKTKQNKTKQNNTIQNKTNKQMRWILHLKFYLLYCFIVSIVEATTPTQPTWCPSGTYTNSTMCIACPHNTYQPANNSASCLPCPAGTQTLDGTTGL